MVRHHHEFFDGQGYPDGLAGEAIPIGARILAVADAFDVITSVRTYQQARPPREAFHELRRVSGRQFDPRIVKAFEEVWTQEQFSLETPPFEDTGKYIIPEK